MLATNRNININNESISINDILPSLAETENGKTLLAKYPKLFSENDFNAVLTEMTA